MSTTTLPLNAAVELAHALVATAAGDRGIRVVFLKGPVATRQGLREPDYVSSDVDAFCEPGRENELVGALIGRGWYLRPESEGHAKFVTHSITLIHDQWPCDIDVHTSYPGFLAPPAVVFEALWQHRQVYELAEIDCLAPDPAAQTLILVLHGLRAPHLHRNLQEIETARSQLASMTSDELDGVERLITATGCAEVVHDVFLAVGRELVIPAEPTVEYRNWQLVTQPSRTEGWVSAVARARGRERLSLVYRAVLPSRERLAIDHPGVATSRAAAARAYRDRLLRAAQLLPAAIRHVVAARRATGHVAVAGSASGVAVAMTPVATGEHSADHGAADTGTGSALLDVLGDDTGSGDMRSADAPVRSAVFVCTDEGGPRAGKAYVLPLTAAQTQVPLEVNAIGLDLLVLLQSVDGDVSVAVSEAERLWHRPAAELRPVIADFRTQMVQAGALAD